jgi:predicted phosphodiesterase
MRYVAFSDVHGNLGNMERFRRGLEGFSRNQTLCAGDIVHRGRIYGESRAVDIVRSIPDLVIVRGNHDILPDEAIEKIPYPNFEYLKELPQEVVTNKYSIFHSSIRNPGKRLESVNQIIDEANFLNDVELLPKYLVFGHTHEARIFEYDDSTRQAREFDSRSEELKEDDSFHYFVNPGTLGEYETVRDHTFALIDDSQKKISIITLDDLEILDAQRRAILLFDENIMPYLSGIYRTRDLSRAILDMKSLDRRDVLGEVVNSLKEGNKRLSRKIKKDTHQKIAQELSQALEKTVDSRVYSYYSIRTPSEAVDSRYYKW